VRAQLERRNQKKGKNMRKQMAAKKIETRKVRRRGEATGRRDISLGEQRQ